MGAGLGIRAETDPGGEWLRVPVSRDAWISAYPGEEHANLGGESRLKLKGIQELSLVDIEPEPLRGRRIEEARLHLKLAGDEVLHRLTVSTVSTPWVEGKGTGYRRREGEVSFRSPAEGERSWAWPGSDLTAVMGGLGSTEWSFGDPTPPRDGWQSFRVAPRVMALRVAGLADGFALQDDVGSEYERKGNEVKLRVFPNRFVAAREAGTVEAPYFEVRLGDADLTPPGRIRDLTVDRGVDGWPELRWRVPSGATDVLGFHARFAVGALDWESARALPRYLVPLARDASEAGEVRASLGDLAALVAGEGERVTVGVRAVDSVGNVGPVSTVQVAVAREGLPEMPSVRPRADAGEAVEPLAVGPVRISVVDPLDLQDPMSGRLIPHRPSGYLDSNHLWDGRTVRLHGARNEHVAFQVLLQGEGAADVRGSFDFASLGGDRPARAALYRGVQVETTSGPIPDPLVPLPRKGDVAGPAPSAASQMLLAELWIPHGARAGEHRGTLRLRSDRDGTVEIPVELRVWNFELPDRLSFLPQLNAYDLPGGPRERPFYRLAHEHRTTLNRLGYNWRGSVYEEFGPDRRPDGKWDWSGFDRRWSAHFDGSAFEDLPRSGVPVEAFYLGLNESWPTRVDSAFEGGYWAERAFTPDYRRRFVEAARELARHFVERGWDGTFFEFYLNNKLSHKASRGWDGASAPWNFDEPINTQDFWALRWYGEAFREGVWSVPGSERVVFRADISRPQWQRDLLDGLLEIDVVGGAVRPYERLVRERRRRTGEVVYAYGETAAVGADPTQPAVWCLEAWVQGLDGIVPWQTIGRERSWREADPLALLYPGKGVEIDGPTPSLRLKSLRRGQQDVEYLAILTATSGIDRSRVAEWAAERLDLRAVDRRTKVDVATAAEYPGVDAEALWRFRTAVGAFLDRAEVRAPTAVLDRAGRVRRRDAFRDVEPLPAP